MSEFKYMEIPYPNNNFSVNSKDPQLTPQIIHEIFITDDVSINTSNQNIIERTAKISIQMFYVPRENLLSVLTKLITQIDQSIKSDLNPVQITDRPREINPIMQLLVNADNGRQTKTISVYANVENIKIAYISAALSRLKDYILNAVEDIQD